MEFFNKWFENLLNRTSLKWKYSVSVNGECRRHTGPSIWFASVTIDFSPNDEFEVEDTLDPEMAKLARKRGWYDYIVFGVLDVLLVSSITSIKSVKITIRQIDFNEIESNQMAFRLAARDAASKALEKHFSFSL